MQKQGKQPILNWPVLLFVLVLRSGVIRDQRQTVAHKGVATEWYRRVLGPGIRNNIIERKKICLFSLCIVRIKVELLGIK